MDEITKELLDALKDTLDFVERHSNRWDGVNGKHPQTVSEAARAAIAKAKAESALAALAAPQPADDGWIPWAGGERPVDTIVEVKLRNGGIIMNFACTYDWRHINDPVDIIAYRVVKP